MASEDDGSCDFCSCQQPGTEYTMTIESFPATQAGLTTYRFYVNMLTPTDRMSAVYGNIDENMVVDAPAGVYNSAFNSFVECLGNQPGFLVKLP